MKKIKFVDIKLQNVINLDVFDVEKKGLLIDVQILRSKGLCLIRFVFEKDSTSSNMKRKFLLVNGEAEIPYDTAELYQSFVFDGESIFLYQI
ncbi:hypothetical protein HOG21_01225 [bacterium]|jgi:hypothetical protein|nr:hypothetical protein [bacterium]